MDLIEVWTDGCCEPINPGGTAGWGVHIRLNGDVIWEKSGMIPAAPSTSNNVAEYMAFLGALEWLFKNNHHLKKIVFRADSKLVIEQMKGNWNMNQGHYIPYAKKAQLLLSKFKFYDLVWIPRDQNDLADELSKKELKQLGVKFMIQKE